MHGRGGGFVASYERPLRDVYMLPGPKPAARPRCGGPPCCCGCGPYCCGPYCCGTCCGGAYGCRFCHDEEAPSHGCHKTAEAAGGSVVRDMRCLSCMCVQPAAQACQNCTATVGEWHSAKWVLVSGLPQCAPQSFYLE